MIRDYYDIIKKPLKRVFRLCVRAFCICMLGWGLFFGAILIIPSHTMMDIMNFIDLYGGTIRDVYEGRLSERYKMVLYHNSEMIEPGSYFALPERERFRWFELFCGLLRWSGHEQEVDMFKRMESDGIRSLFLDWLYLYKTEISQNIQNGKIEEARLGCAILLDIHHHLALDDSFRILLEETDANWGLDKADILLHWNGLYFNRMPVLPRNDSWEKGISEGEIFRDYPLLIENTNLLKDIFDVVIRRLYILSAQLSEKCDYVALRRLWKIFEDRRERNIRNRIKSIGGIGGPAIDRSNWDSITIPWVSLDSISEDIFIPQTQKNMK